MRDVSHRLRVLETIHGPMHEALRPLVDELGDLQERDGQVLEALVTYVRALELRLELLGTEGATSTGTDWPTSW